MRMASSVAFLVAFGCAAADVHGFNIGPYRLGMTNAEAKRLGLADCKVNNKLVECQASGLKGITNLRHAIISFDPKTGVAKRLEAQVYYDHMTGVEFRADADGMPLFPPPVRGAR